MIGFGTILNGIGILVGGAMGLTMTRQMSVPTQQLIKVGMGLFTIFVGLKMTWDGLHGSFLQALKQLAIVVLSLMVGKLIGKGLRLQEWSNRAGQYAKQKMGETSKEAGRKFSEGFVTCTMLFCIGPMAIVGSLQDGLTGDFKLLGIKAIMDGMATMVFTTMFGWGAIVSVVPVVAYQGTVTLAARWLEPYLKGELLIDSIGATGGMLVFSIALVIFGVKKIELTNYLPSLAVAPLLTWLWR